MQQKPSQKSLIDYLSTNDLLNALNKLQQIKQDQILNYQLSFSQSNHSLNNNNNNNNNNQINFDLYIALKNNINQNNQNKNKNKQNKNKNQFLYQSHTNHNNPHKNNKSAQNIRKSLTPNNKQPLTQINNNIINKNKQNTQSATKLTLNNSIDKSIRKKKLSQIKQYEQPKKSRSQSPWLTSRSNLIPKTNFSSSSSSQLVFNSAFKSKKNKQNDPIPSQNNTQNCPKGIKILENSKKIMMEKQKKGQTYIPIQNRTNLLIKQKQQKIAQIKKMNLTQKEIQQRQCTFKPQINQYKKISTNKENFIKQNRLNLSSIPIESFIQEPQNSQINYSSQVDGNKKKTQQKIERKIDGIQKKDKPKNSKFNILLDLIH